MEIPIRKGDPNKLVRAIKDPSTKSKKHLEAIANSPQQSKITGFFAKRARGDE